MTSSSAEHLHLQEQQYREADVFGRLSRLPPMRSASVRLLMISLESDSAIADFERAFQSDPALAADLLLVANSPLFGLRTKIHSIRHAIAMLGLENVRSLALTISMKGYIGAGGSSDALRMGWRHSMAVAVIAEQIGHDGGTAAPLLYTGGLMHDVGRLGLFQISPAKYQQIVSAQFTSTREYEEVEKLLFGCSHEDAGAFLGMAWGFPDALCDCIRFHHCEIATHAGQLFALVNIACRLADCLGYPEVQQSGEENSVEAVLELLPARLRQAPGLSAEALKAKVESHLRSFSAGSSPQVS